MIVESTTYTSLVTRTCSQVKLNRIDMAMNKYPLNGTDNGVSDDQKNENRNSIPIHQHDHRKSRSNVRFDVSIELRQI